MNRTVMAVLTTAFLLTGCGGGTPPPLPRQEAPPLSDRIRAAMEGEYLVAGMTVEQVERIVPVPPARRVLHSGSEPDAAETWIYPDATVRYQSPEGTFATYRGFAVSVQDGKLTAVRMWGRAVNGS